MNKEKQKRLEAAGFRVGDAGDFLGHDRMPARRVFSPVGT